MMLYGLPMEKQHTLKTEFGGIRIKDIQSATIKCMDQKEKSALYPIPKNIRN